jgi:MFS family permease
LPSLIGNLSQIFSPKLMEKKSRKEVISLGVLLQALMWLPLILIAFLFLIKKQVSSSIIMFVIGIYTLITLFGAIASPAWNSLMKDIVEEKNGDYFGKGNRIMIFL